MMEMAMRNDREVFSVVLISSYVYLKPSYPQLAVFRPAEGKNLSESTSVHPDESVLLSISGQLYGNIA